MKLISGEGWLSLDPKIEEKEKGHARKHGRMEELTPSVTETDMHGCADLLRLNRMEEATYSPLIELNGRGTKHARLC